MTNVPLATRPAHTATTRYIPAGKAVTSSETPFCRTDCRMPCAEITLTRSKAQSGSPASRTVPVAGGRVLARRLPRARLIELPTGHAGMIDPRVDVAAWLERTDLWDTGDAS